MVVLVLLAVIAGVVLAIWQPWRGMASPSASQKPTPSASSVTPSATPAESETPAPAESSEPAPSDSETPAVTPTCTGSDLEVLAITDKESYGSGELPQLSISLTNTSETPCLINVGTAKQEFTISSGSDVWWRSTDCQTEPSDQVVELAAGQNVSSVTPITWDRTRSSADTCDGTRPAALPGYYNLRVSIGGIQSTGARQFVLR